MLGTVDEVAADPIGLGLGVVVQESGSNGVEALEVWDGEGQCCHDVVKFGNLPLNIVFLEERRSAVKVETVLTFLLTLAVEGVDIGVQVVVQPGQHTVEVIPGTDSFHEYLILEPAGNCFHTHIIFPTQIFQDMVEQSGMVHHLQPPGQFALVGGLVLQC